MAKIRIEKKYDGISPDVCFEASKSAFPNAGFEIIKIRDIAWLVLAKREEDGKIIEANIGARPPAVCANVTFTVSSSDLDKTELQRHIEKIIAEFEKVK